MILRMRALAGAEPRTRLHSEHHSWLVSRLVIVVAWQSVIVTCLEGSYASSLQHCLQLSQISHLADRQKWLQSFSCCAWSQSAGLLLPAILSMPPASSTGRHDVATCEKKY